MAFKDMAFGGERRMDWMISDVPENVLTSFGRRGKDARGNASYYRKTRAGTHTGEQALASGDGSVAVGASSFAMEDGATAVGNSARAERRSATVVGRYSRAAGVKSTHVGEGGSTTGINGTSVGQAVLNTGNHTTAVGQSVVATGTRTTIVGQDATSAHNDCVAIGKGAITTANNQFIVGSSDAPIQGVVWGNGYSNSAPTGLVLIRLTQGSGSNVVGTKMQVSPGVGTGNALPAEIQFFGTGIGSSGSTAQTEYERLIINGSRADLTSGAAFQILSLTMANNTMMGGTIFYTIECSDGADYQSAAGVVTFTAVNDAGVATGGATQDHERSTVTAGSLSSAWAFSASTIRVTPTTAGLGSLTIFRISYSVFNNGSGGVSSAHV